MIGWGYNIHGQIDGAPSDDAVLRPKVVPFFIGKRVKIVAASRSRSMAVTEDNEIFEWGFSESDQFSQFASFDEEVADVKLGSTFTLILTESGKVWFKGEITQEGSRVIDSYGELQCLNELMSKKDLMVPGFATSFWKQRKEEKGEETEEVKEF